MSDCPPPRVVDPWWDSWCCEKLDRATGEATFVIEKLYLSHEQREQVFPLLWNLAKLWCHFHGVPWNMTIKDLLHENPSGALAMLREKAADVRAGAGSS